MSKHTPLPWQRNIPPASHYPTIFSGRNQHVLTLTTRGMDPAEVEANAEFIVRAVNCHDELVAALRTIADFPCNCAPDALPGDECESCIARASLAKALPAVGNEATL